MSRSRRGLGRKEAKNHDRRKALIIAGSVGAAILVAGIAAVCFRPEPIDPETGCPATDRAPPAHTIILVDETDSFTPGELRYARDLIRTEYFWLPTGGKLTVRNIMAAPEDDHEVNICRMRDASSALGIMVNPEALQRTFERLAGAQLNELLDGLEHVEPQPASPILEAVGATVDRADFGRGIDDRRLVIHSDFAQHSDLVSHYSDGGYDMDEEATDVLWRDMSGVHVRLHYIPRRSLSSIQGRRHQAFWTRWFEDMEVEDVELGHDLLIGEEPDRPIIVSDSGGTRP